MKKLLCIILLLLLMPVAKADNLKSLNAATSTGAGTDFSLTAKKIGQHTVHVTVTGSPTAVTVALEGSLDRTGWAAIATHAFTAAEITAQFAVFHITNKPVDYIRANLTVLTGGTTPTVTALILSE